MAKRAFLDPVIYIAGNELTDWVSKLEFEYMYEQQPTTTFGDGGAETVVGGLETGSIGLDFKIDYAPAALNDVMESLVSRTPVTCTFKPEDAAVSSANKLYTVSILVNSWQPVAGNVGEVQTISRQYTKSGTFTVTTTG